MKKILKAKCVSCGKEIFSMYKNQLDYNLKAHKIACPKRTKEESQEDKDSPVVLDSGKEIKI